MRKIQNISAQTEQRHTVLYLETEITLTLHYYPTVELWTMDVQYKNFTISGVGLAVNVLHMEASNQPFGFVVRDTTGNGLDPFRATDFQEGRTELYLIEADEMATIRGIEVQL